MRTRLRKGKGNFLNNVRKLTDVEKENVQVGHFSEQGTHHSGKSYPELMQMHHNGGRTDEGNPLPPRPVLDILKFRLIGLKDPSIRREIRNWIKRPPTKSSTLGMMDAVGREIAEKEKDIFGDPSTLAPNAERTIEEKGKDTPLVDTGDLEEHVGYKNSISKTIKGG